MIDAAPVVAGDTVYFGSRDRHVYAVALATGEMKSSWDAGAWVMADPLPVDGSLLVAVRNGTLVRLR